MDFSAIANRVLIKASMRTGLSLNNPVSICARMTMRCNSRCVHCNIWKKNFGPELETDQWLRALDNLRAWLGAFEMVFTGGEALLRPDMPLLLEHAVALGIRAELLSNGICMDEQKAIAVAATGIDQITISLDGISPSVHDAFRGKSGFHDKTMSAINALNSARRKREMPLRILLKTVISANNLHELVPIAVWAKEQGLEVQFQPIEQNYEEDLDPAWYHASPLWIKDLDLLCETINTLRQQRAQGAAIANSDDDFLRYIEYFKRPDAMMAIIQAHCSENYSSHCPMAVGDFNISSNGDVRMCFLMEPIGNIALKKPETIWKERKRCWSGPCDHR
jgi:MoaA/NifB/PqqE/SkfB family radical SAM enzyme